MNLDNLLWSKGPINNSYLLKQTEDFSSENEIQQLIKQSKNIIFIRNGSKHNFGDIYHFANNLDLLTKKIILITTDGDNSVPSSYDQSIVLKILNHKFIHKWYTQNYDKSIIHSKLNHFPIGFDFHTKRWLINNSINLKIQFMIQSRLSSHTEQRIKNKIFSDTHFCISHPQRVELFNTIKENKNFDFIQQKLSFIEITKKYNEYNFVLSPRGNGVDCHRTWELFLAGVIVITKTSSLDDMFINNNLPVVILNNWEELNSIDNEQLNKWYEKYKQFTDFDLIWKKLKFKYWINFI